MKKHKRDWRVGALWLTPLLALILYYALESLSIHDLWNPEVKITLQWTPTGTQQVQLLDRALHQHPFARSIHICYPRTNYPDGAYVVFQKSNGRVDTIGGYFSGISHEMIHESALRGESIWQLEKKGQLGMIF